MNATVSSGLAGRVPMLWPREWDAVESLDLLAGMPIDCLLFEGEAPARLVGNAHPRHRHGIARGHGNLESAMERPRSRTAAGRRLVASRQGRQGGKRHRGGRPDRSAVGGNRAARPLVSFKRNQFGASMGGPVWLPGIYSGRNKTFFFTTYEGRRVRSGTTATQSLPSAFERAGDFSQTFNAAGALRVVYDPFSTRPDPARAGRFVRDPFAGNRLPANRLPANRLDPDSERLVIRHGNLRRTLDFRSLAVRDE